MKTIQSECEECQKNERLMFQFLPFDISMKFTHSIELLPLRPHIHTFLFKLQQSFDIEVKREKFFRLFIWKILLIYFFFFYGNLHIMGRITLAYERIVDFSFYTLLEDFSCSFFFHFFINIPKTKFKNVKRDVRDMRLPKRDVVYDEMICVCGIYLFFLLPPSKNCKIEFLNFIKSFFFEDFSTQEHLVKKNV